MQISPIKKFCLSNADCKVCDFKMRILCKIKSYISTLQVKRINKIFDLEKDSYKL